MNEVLCERCDKPINLKKPAYGVRMVGDTCYVHMECMDSYILDKMGVVLVDSIETDENYIRNLER